MDVRHIAKLANVDLSASEEELFESQFNETLKAIMVINELDTSGVQPTSQVTGRENVTREDEIDKSRILDQTAAISQARQTYKGYIVVPSIFNEQ